MKITGKMRLDFLISRLGVSGIGVYCRGKRKKSYTEWGMNPFCHWKKWRRGGEDNPLIAIDAAIRAEAQKGR